MKTEEEHKLLELVERLEREVEHLKRELIRSLARTPVRPREEKPSLFGTVRAGDIPEALIEEAKRDLFRELREL